MEARLELDRITIYHCKGIAAAVDALAKKTHLGLSAGLGVDLATNDLTDILCHFCFHLLLVLFLNHTTVL
jgi:hypothetical protein